MTPAYPVKAYFQAGGERLSRRASDELPDAYMQLRDLSGAAFDLTGHTLVALLYDLDGDVPVGSPGIAATVDTAGSGLFHFGLASGDMAKLRVPSRTEIVIEVTKTDGGKKFRTANRPIIEVQANW